MGATKHLVVQGVIPLVMTGLATAVALTTTPSKQTIRLLHNLAAGLLFGTVSAELFPDMIKRSMEGPANKLGTATGFMLAAFLSVVVYEHRERVPDPTPEQQRDTAEFQSSVGSAVLGFITGSVLFERQLDGLSLPYILAAGVGIRAFIGTLLATMTYSDTEPHSRRYRVGKGTGNMCEIAAFFALAMAVVPLTARSVRPIYCLMMGFVTIQSVAMAVADIVPAGGNSNLSLHDHKEAVMFYIGEALVLVTSWLSHTAQASEALAKAARGLKTLTPGRGLKTLTTARWARGR
jgi:hypothetical protein